MYRGLEYHLVHTYADSLELQFEKTRVLGGASMGTRRRPLAETTPRSYSQNPNDHLKLIAALNELDRDKRASSRRSSIFVGIRV